MIPPWLVLMQDRDSEGVRALCLGCRDAYEVRRAIPVKEFIEKAEKFGTMHNGCNPDRNVTLTPVKEGGQE